MAIEFLEYLKWQIKVVFIPSYDSSSIEDATELQFYNYVLDKQSITLEIVMEWYETNDSYYSDCFFEEVIIKWKQDFLNNKT